MISIMGYEYQLRLIFLAWHIQVPFLKLWDPNLVNAVPADGLAPNGAC